MEKHISLKGRTIMGVSATDSALLNLPLVKRLIKQINYQHADRKLFTSSDGLQVPYLLIPVDNDCEFVFKSGVSVTDFDKVNDKFNEELNKIRLIAISIDDKHKAVRYPIK